jgi:hypothetical protein
VQVVALAGAVVVGEPGLPLLVARKGHLHQARVNRRVAHAAGELGGVAGGGAADDEVGDGHSGLGLLLGGNASSHAPS